MQRRKLSNIVDEPVHGAGGQIVMVNTGEHGGTVGLPLSELDNLSPKSTQEVAVRVLPAINEKQQETDTTKRGSR